MTDGLAELSFVGGRLAVSVPVYDADSAAIVWEAGEGAALPTLEAADFASVEALVRVVRQVTKRVPVLSVALGGGADPSQWEKVLAAGEAGAQHLNQPFATASFVKGRLPRAWVNGVVEPGAAARGVRLVTVGADGPTVSARAASRLLREGQLDALKVHPTDPSRDFRSTLTAARFAAELGLTGFEPAGGLDAANLPRLAERLLGFPNIKVIAHVFSAVKDPSSGRTDPGLVERLVGGLRAVVG